MMNSCFSPLTNNKVTMTLQYVTSEHLNRIHVSSYISCSIWMLWKDNFCFQNASPCTDFMMWVVWMGLMTKVSQTAWLSAWLQYLSPNGPYSNIIHIMLYYYILFKYIQRHLHLRKSARVSGSGIDMFCFAATIAWTVVFIPILSEIKGKYIFQSLKTHRSLNLCLLHVQKKKKKSIREGNRLCSSCMWPDLH